MITDTIVALSSAPLESAIAVIRMSGKEAYRILKEILDVPFKETDHRKILHGHIIDKEAKEEIDDVVVIIYKGPKSFTGEDMVEINCHGSLIVINRIISLCIKYGARQAKRGEFSEKSFLNGKIDLIQAESINDLIHATSETATKVAVQGLKGSVSNKIQELKEDLIDIISHIEINIDYPEYEDIEQLTNEILLPKIDKLLVKTQRTLDEARTGKMLKDGIKVAIVGKPNAGKSSLLNALLEEDKAIVTDIAGTTRDVVEGRITIEGLPFLLLDTAGIRNPANKVEQIGVERSKKAIEDADIVVVVIDGSKAGNQMIDEDLGNKPTIVVINKEDLGIKNKEEGIHLSAVSNNIEPLKKELVKKAGIEIREYDQYALLSNARQIGLMLKAHRQLEDAKAACENATPIDLIYIDLNLALDAILEILGLKSKTDLEAEIFSRFCVGK